MKCETCEKDMTPQDRGIEITDYRCFDCDNKVTKVYGLPSRIIRATQMLEGKEMVDAVINTLIEYKQVEPLTKQTKGE